MKLFNIVDYKIPMALRQFVLAVVQGETPAAVQVSMPAPPTGFPLLIYIYGDYPNLTINGKSFVPTTVPLNVAGQIDVTGIRMEVNGVFGQIGLILHPLAPYYLFHIPGNEMRNVWKGLLKALPKKSKKYFESIPKDNEPLEIITHILAALEKLVPHRIEPIAWLDATMLEIFRNNGSVSMADLLAQTSFSARHFRRKFKDKGSFSSIVSVTTEGRSSLSVVLKIRQYLLFNSKPYFFDDRNCLDALNADPKRLVSVT